MKLVPATPEDSEDLKVFFESFVIPGRIDLRTVRHQHYFDLYRIQTDSFKVFVLRDGANKIHGTCAITYRMAYIEGKPQKIGLIRDLRIAKDRNALLSWSESFLPTLEQEMAESGCAYFFSLIDENSAQSYNTLIRPKSRKQKMPRYYLLRKFYLIALHGHFSLFFKALAGVNLRSANQSDIPKLVKYLNGKSRKRPLGPIFEVDHFVKTLQNWPGLQLNDFIIAEDTLGKIVGCCAPWSPHPLKTLVVEKHHGFTKGVRKLFTWGSHVKITRRLAKESESLSVSYLTHFFADNPDIFHSLLNEVWMKSPKSQTLLYPYFMGQIEAKPPSGFIYTKTPFATYTILPPHRNLPPALRPRIQSPPPYLELALL